MKTIILTAALMGYAIAPASATDYGWKAQLDAMGCTGAGIGQAFRGDFSQWVLPSFIGGTHMKAGQWIEAQTGADGVRRCKVR